MAKGTGWMGRGREGHVVSSLAHEFWFSFSWRHRPKTAKAGISKSVTSQLWGTSLYCPPLLFTVLGLQDCRIADAAGLDSITCSRAGKKKRGRMGWSLRFAGTCGRKCAV